MKINVTLHGILRDYLSSEKKGKATLNLTAKATVADVINQLKIKQTVSAVVNEEDVDTNYILQDGDSLQMFRIIGGG